MFNFKVEDKEYKIQFSLMPTVKAKLVSKLAKLEANDSNEVEQMENALAFIPEMILVGLQAHHKDEFSYDYNTNEGFDELLVKVFDMVDKHLSMEGAKFQDLYSGLENELLENGFLSSLFQQEQAKEQKKANKKTAKTEEN